MYRNSPTAHHVSKNRQGGFWGSLANLCSGLFLLFCLLCLPILILLAVSWIAYFLTAHSFYHASWMLPGLLLFSAFLGGVYIRQTVEDRGGGMGLFFLGLMALVLFAVLTYRDILEMGGIYSHFMPRFLSHSLLHYVGMLPGVGLVGMVSYRFFSIRA